MGEIELRHGPIRVERVERSPSWRGAMTALGLVAASGFLVPSGPLPSLGWAALTLLPVSMAAWLTYHGARRTRAAAEVGRAGVLVDGKLALPRARARRGRAAATPDGRFQLDLGGPFGLRLVVPTREDARAVLGALGLDRRAGTTRFRVREHPAPGAEAGVVLGSLALLLLAVTASVWPAGARLALVAPLLLPLAVGLLGRVELTVGADGLELTAHGRRRFVPHARIAGFTRLGSGRRVSPGFAIVLDDGERIPLDTRGERFRTGIYRADPVLEAASAAWHAARSASTSPAPPGRGAPRARARRRLLPHRRARRPRPRGNPRRRPRAARGARRGGGRARREGRGRQAPARRGRRGRRRQTPPDHAPGRRVRPRSRRAPGRARERRAPEPGAARTQRTQRLRGAPATARRHRHPVG